MPTPINPSFSTPYSIKCTAAAKSDSQGGKKGIEEEEERTFCCGKLIGRKPEEGLKRLASLHSIPPKSLKGVLLYGRTRMTTKTKEPREAWQNQLEKKKRGFGVEGRDLALSAKNLFQHSGLRKPLFSSAPLSHCPSSFPFLSAPVHPAADAAVVARSHLQTYTRKIGGQGGNAEKRTPLQHFFFTCNTAW